MDSSRPSAVCAVSQVFTTSPNQIIPRGDWPSLRNINVKPYELVSQVILIKAHFFSCRPRSVQREGSSFLFRGCFLACRCKWDSLSEHVLWGSDHARSSLVDALAVAPWADLCAQEVSDWPQATRAVPCPLTGWAMTQETPERARARVESECGCAWETRVRVNGVHRRASGRGWSRARSTHRWERECSPRGVADADFFRFLAEDICARPLSSWKFIKICLTNVAEIQ